MPTFYPSPDATELRKTKEYAIAVDNLPIIFPKNRALDSFSLQYLSMSLNRVQNQPTISLDILFWSLLDSGYVSFVFLNEWFFRGK